MIPAFLKSTSNFFLRSSGQRIILPMVFSFGSNNRPPYFRTCGWTLRSAKNSLKQVFVFNTKPKPAVGFGMFFGGEMSSHFGRPFRKFGSVFPMGFFSAMGPFAWGAAGVFLDSGLGFVVAVVRGLEMGLLCLIGPHPTKMKPTKKKH